MHERFFVTRVNTEYLKRGSLVTDSKVYMCNTLQDAQEYLQRKDWPSLSDPSPRIGIITCALQYDDQYPKIEGWKEPHGKGWLVSPDAEQAYDISTAHFHVSGDNLHQPVDFTPQEYQQLRNCLIIRTTENEDYQYSAIRCASSTTPSIPLLKLRDYVGAIQQWYKAITSVDPSSQEYIFPSKHFSAFEQAVAKTQHAFGTNRLSDDMLNIAIYEAASTLSLPSKTEIYTLEPTEDTAINARFEEVQKYALNLIIERASECIDQGQSIPIIQSFQDVLATTLASINDAEISQAFENQYASKYKAVTGSCVLQPRSICEAQAAIWAVQALSQQYDQLQPLCTAAQMCEKILCECEVIDPMFGFTPDEKAELEELEACEEW